MDDENVVIIELTILARTELSPSLCVFTTGINYNNNHDQFDTYGII